MRINNMSHLLFDFNSNGKITMYFMGGNNMAIKIFVDSGSSIKQEEKDMYNVEIIPLKILLDGKEYLDGVDLSMDIFYDALINKKEFPKTSLPNLADVEEKVNKCVSDGDDVIILTISSGISGTYNAMRMLFEGNDKVRVIDSKTAVGGMKIIVKEINKYIDKPIDFVEGKINELIPKIRVYAVPETLDYLHKGGRLSKVGYIAGTILNLKPVIELREKVSVASKQIGLIRAMKYLVSRLDECDVNYPIVPSYTYDCENLDKLISRVGIEYQNVMIDKDNLDPAIAAHWGPNAFGFIFVSKN